MTKWYNIEYETQTVWECPKCLTNNIEESWLDCDDMRICDKCGSKFKYDYSREDVWEWDKCFYLLK